MQTIGIPPSEHEGELKKHDELACGPGRLEARRARGDRPRLRGHHALRQPLPPGILPSGHLWRS
jgi:hypothetical protein